MQTIRNAAFIYSMETRNRANYAAAAGGRGPPPAAPATPPAARYDVKLPTYWDHNPEGWFSFIEARFRVCSLNDEAVMFDVAASNLSEAAVDLSIDLLKTRPAVQPYSALRRRLLTEHQPTPFQRARSLRSAPDMGDRSPSQLLVALIKLCPEGEEDSVLFKEAFLHRLPETLEMLLGDHLTEPIRDLAKRADRYWTAHRSKQTSAINNVETELAAQDELLDSVNAVRFQAHKGGRGGGKSRGRGGRGGSSRGRNDKSGKGRTGGLMDAPPGSGLCAYHWSFGDGALSCRSPCSWTGN